MFVISCIAILLSVVSGTVPPTGDTMDSSLISNQIETIYAPEESVDSMCFSFVEDNDDKDPFPNQTPRANQAPF